MATFNEREKSFETRFVQEQELQFKATARRNHLAGLWTAKKLGLTAIDSEAYAKSLVTADLDAPGSDAVFTKIQSDLKSSGILEPDHKIRRMLDDFMTQAFAALKGVSGGEKGG